VGAELLFGRSSRLAAVALLCVACLPAAARAAEPQIPAAWVTDVSPTSAVLRAEINPEGEATTYRFEYIREAAYQANLGGGKEGFAGAVRVPAGIEPGIGSGGAPHAVAQSLVAPLNPLTPATAYRYRPVATNGSGAATGPIHVLTTRAATSDPALPDARAWELVSPVDKGGGAIAAPGALFGGGDVQAAAGGGALTYGSTASFGDAAGAPPASQYVSRRGGEGWSTENVSAPLESSSYGDTPDGVPYRLFSANLGAGLLFGGQPCRGVPGCPAPAPPLSGSGAPAGFSTYYRRGDAAGAFRSLLTAADLAHSAVSAEHFEIGLAAATPDLAHVVLSSCAALTADAVEVAAGPGECDGAEPNLYEWSGGGLALVNLLPGAAIAAPLGAVSDDGLRVYFTDGEGDLYLREIGGATVLIPETAAGGASFQVASSDGSVAFFTKGGHLYRYLAVAGTSTDITPVGGVAGVLGAAADGETVYYQDAAGLQRWQAGAVATVAAGANVAAASDFPPATGTARVSADGLHLAFLSAAAIPPFDNLDTNTGLPDTELYLYGPPAEGGAARLVCASCNPSGERPRGSASIPGAQVNGTTTAYKPSVLAANGQRVFFDSADKLVVADTNARPDAYQWESRGEGSCTRSPGCVSLISSGRGEGGSFLDASADGGDAFFLSGDSLVGADPGSIDVYDARAGGGLPEPQRPIACVGDACQALPSPPADPTPGTIVPSSGNPPPKIVREKRRHRHHKHHRRRGHGGGGRR
jgi:hypothetical protein